VTYLYGLADFIEANFLRLKNNPALPFGRRPEFQLRADKQKWVKNRLGSAEESQNWASSVRFIGLFIAA
jgi:hypothetical protein